jgi:hypothetical protein
MRASRRLVGRRIGGGHSGCQPRPGPAKANGAHRPRRGVAGPRCPSWFAPSRAGMDRARAAPRDRLPGRSGPTGLLRPLRAPGAVLALTRPGCRANCEDAGLTGARGRGENGAYRFLRSSRRADRSCPFRTLGLTVANVRLKPSSGDLASAWSAAGRCRGKSRRRRCLPIREDRPSITIARRTAAPGRTGTVEGFTLPSAIVARPIYQDGARNEVNEMIRPWRE